MESKIRIGFISVFICIIVFLGIATIDNKVTSSNIEGRKYELFPDFKINKLTDSKYLKKYETAFADQLEFREKLVKYYYFLQCKILRKSYVGSTVIGKDEYLFLEPSIYDSTKKEQEIKEIAEIINKKAKEVNLNGSKFIYVSYPRKDAVLQDYLPKWYPDTRKTYINEIKILKENLSDDVILIDALDVFEKNKNNEQEVFYKTDHHVNFYGQSLVYSEIMKIVKNDYNDIVVRTMEDYEVKENIVEGSYDRKLGKIYNCKEALNIKPKFELEYERWESGVKSDIPIFGEGNTYASAYMGNDYAQTTIITKNIEKPNILISGTSFTNALESLMCSSFYKTTAVDYRHNKSKKTVDEYVKERNVKYTIFIPANQNASFSYESVKAQLGL